MNLNDGDEYSQERIHALLADRRASTASDTKSWLISECRKMNSGETLRTDDTSLNENTPLLEEGLLNTDTRSCKDDVANILHLTRENGALHTTWKHEAKVLAAYSRPLIITFVLQYSIPLISVVTVGHLGKAELGAVSISSSKNGPHKPSYFDSQSLYMSSDSKPDRHRLG